MNILRIIEGKIKSILFGNDGNVDRKLRTKNDGTLTISNAPKQPYKYAIYDNIYEAEVDRLFDFNGMKRDVYLKITNPCYIKLNDISNESIHLDMGEWIFENEWIEKMYITNEVSTLIQIYASGE